MGAEMTLYTDMVAAASKLRRVIKNNPELSDIYNDIMESIKRYESGVKPDDGRLTADDIILEMASMVFGRPSAPIWIPDLRTKVGAKTGFDEALMAAVTSGEVFLNRHAYPGILSAQERGAFVTDSVGDVYCVAALKNRHAMAGW